jgi:hypothetical protein
LTKITKLVYRKDGKNDGMHEGDGGVGEELIKE